jgi:hypothetical protein
VHLSSCWRLQLLAEAQLLAGAIEDAFVSIEDAFESSASERVHQPAILMLCAEIRLKLGQPGAAETDFREGSALARKINWKLAELRVTNRLAQLLRDTNRRDEARTMLAEIYNWFTESFDTADLKEAKALPEELS